MTTEQFHRTITAREAYASFFDHEWARWAGDLADRVGLADHMFDLCVTWKGVANTVSMPWLMVETLCSFARGHSNAQRPFPEQWLDKIAINIDSQILPPLDPNQRHSLHRFLAKHNIQVHRDFCAQSPPIDEDVYWGKLIDLGELRIAIVATQRMCFSQLFFAYENFLLRAVRKELNDNTVRIGREFPGYINRAFQAGWGRKLWTSHDVRVARLVRHALAHAGARLTPELAKLNHGVEVVDEHLQITVAHNRALFSLLQKKITEVLNYLDSRGA